MRTVAPVPSTTTPALPPSPLPTPRTALLQPFVVAVVVPLRRPLRVSMRGEKSTGQYTQSASRITSGTGCCGCVAEKASVIPTAPAASSFCARGGGERGGGGGGAQPFQSSDPHDRAATRMEAARCGFASTLRWRMGRTWAEAASRRHPRSRRVASQVPFVYPERSTGREGCPRRAFLTSSRSVTVDDRAPAAAAKRPTRPIPLPSSST